MNKFFFLFLLIALQVSLPEKGFCQLYHRDQVRDAVWDKLAETKFKRGKPQFSKNAKAMHGKKVRVKGYLYPLTQSTSHTHFILTSLPTSSCFFCGVGGPETIMEVLASEKIRFTKKVIELEGTLMMNPDSEDHLTVMLLDAVQVGH